MFYNDIIKYIVCMKKKKKKKKSPLRAESLVVNSLPWHE